MTAIAHHPHRVTRAITAVRRQLGQVAEVPVWSMDATETTTALADVTRLEAQLAELKARLLTHAEQTHLAAETGAASTATWHAVATTTSRREAHRATRLAAGLDTHDATRAALAAGRVHAEQAEAILRALADLPTDLDPQTAVRAEEQLLDLAATHDAKALRLLGRRILEVISPDAADAHEAALLERE